MPGWPPGTPPQVISPARNGFKWPGLDPGGSVVCDLQAIRLVDQKQEV